MQKLGFDVSLSTAGHGLAVHPICKLICLQPALEKRIPVRACHHLHGRSPAVPALAVDQTSV